MGIEWNTAKFLIACRTAGVSMEKTLTLGHQVLRVEDDQLRSLFGVYGRELAGQAARSSGKDYADRLFTMLGAEEVTSVDFSDYDEASLIHDLNLPFPAEHRERYDLVFDGGTLEHLFNFPAALSHCMEAVSVGGHFILQTPTNNYSGHGFYQFSPELFYRALSPENGFRIIRMVACELVDGSDWFEVADPATAGTRVEIASGTQRVSLLILAQRTHACPIFSRNPQQSDYIRAWTDPQSGVRVSPGAFRRAYRAFRDRRFGHAMLRYVAGRIGLTRLAQRHATRHLTLTGQPSVFRRTQE